MAKSTYTYGFLPHLSGSLVFVTFRLADSLPMSAMNEIKVFERYWQMKSDRGEWTADMADEYRQKRAALENDLLDKALGSCILKDESVRQQLVDVIMHFDKVRYLVHTFVIMPNHVHLLLEPFEGWRIQDIMHSIKSYSTKVINRMLGRSDVLWEREYFDRRIRDSRHYGAVVRYIEGNPRHCAKGEYSYYRRGLQDG